MEKVRQMAFKADSPTVSEAARVDGIYRGRARPFCLPRDYAMENLYPGIRASAPPHFARHGIKWHDGRDGNPSNHLCDSQVCCVNFLFPFADQPRALGELLRPFYPALRKTVPIEDGNYVAHEWIGEHNYLGRIVRQYLSQDCPERDRPDCYLSATL